MTLVKTTVDRIEGDYAVLIADNESGRLTIPVSLLPAGTIEGDSVSVSLERNEEETAAAKKRLAGLIGKLSRR